MDPMSDLPDLTLVPLEDIPFLSIRQISLFMSATESQKDLCCYHDSSYKMRGYVVNEWQLHF